jgi:hypothetical protein
MIGGREGGGASRMEELKEFFAKKRRSVDCVGGIWVVEGNVWW